MKSVFLNGFIEDEVYVSIPLGFEKLDFYKYVFKLKYGLNGLKQTPIA